MNNETFSPTDMEKAAIKQWVTEGLTDAQIAKKFKTKKVRITEFLSENNIVRPKIDKVKKAGFANKTKNDKKGIVAATESSSSRGDTFDKTSPASSIGKYAGSIHKIDNDG